MKKRRISKLILPLLGIFFLFSANFFAYAEDNKANSLLDNLVTETEYLNDSIFIFSYREKSPDSNGKIVCYPPIKCKILDEDNKTCQLLGCAKISEEWLQELKNGITTLILRCVIALSQMYHFRTASRGTFDTRLGKLAV